ncbi:putative regulatory protein, MarR [Geomonas silvestris]|uniref:Putative regulatory protein, MarR n=1 Tax=Geomonas silvestris TaxID=2740184 RepID=A0A6V8MI56_9BACT|nr:MarR family winged helix-turn-helix transcriptional regulator [Geomonas silvestris]GFO59607.1 putative regulatory protein, MarR [Geomonas silvestris]
MDPTAENLAVTIANECLAGKARRLSRVITGIYDRALMPFGIKINQASILVFLSRTGEASPGDIVNRLQMEKSTVSRNVDRMRKSGWIEVVERGGRGGQLLRITPAGQKLLVDSHPHWQQAQEKAQALLGAEGSDSLRLLAERIR